MAVPPDSAAGAPPDTTLGPPPDTTGAEGTPPDTTTVADTIPDVGRDATPRAALEMALEKGRVTSTTDPPWARRREHP